MNDTTDYPERVGKIRQIAEARYSGFDRWRFRQEETIYAGDPLRWRLDVWNDGINGHCIFDLREDLSTDEILSKLEGMDICTEEVLSTQEKEEI